MSKFETEKRPKKRLLAAALISAGAILLGTFLSVAETEQIGLIWLATAVFMVGPLLTALIVWPLVNYDRWLFITASLLSAAVVVPWAFLTPSQWASTLLSQLGNWANVLFFVLLLSTVNGDRPCPRRLSWLLTGFYLLILWFLPILLL